MTASTTTTKATTNSTRLTSLQEDEVGGGEGDDVLNTSIGSNVSGNTAEMAAAGDFEALMKERTRIRKEREDHSVAELRVRIQKLEYGLVGEIKRRVESIEKLESQTNESMECMENRLIEKIELQSSIVDDRLSSLEERINELEIKFDCSSQEQINNIESSKKEYKSMIDEIKNNVINEKKNKLIREEQLIKQIESHKNEFENKYITEQDERNNSINKIQNNIISNQNIREKQNNEFQNKISYELNLLTKELKNEITIRETQDEEIIVALNKYTKQLQQSLNILSGE